MKQNAGLTTMKLVLGDIRLDYKENLLLLTKSTLKLVTSNERMQFFCKKRYPLHLTRCRKVALQNLEVFNLGNAFSIIFKQRGFAKDGNKKCAKRFAEMKK